MISKYKIPFNRSTCVGKELSYISEVIRDGHISGDGAFTMKCQALLKHELGVQRVFLTTSCTHALEMAALLLDIKSGDEVIVPSFTFVSTVNAFVLRGARPVFIDVRSDTINLDESQLEQHITSRTKAILPVHYAGVGCEMDVVLEIAHHYHIPVIEDNAHGLFGKYKGKYLGTFGSLATQSFHETKNFSCGEGGALLINDPSYIERSEIIREKGTNRSCFFRGQVDKYSWVDIGSSYLPSDILAAFLFAQLEMREAIQAQRKELWDNYYQQLEDWALKYNVRLPVIPPYCEQTYHTFYLLMPSLELRQGLIEHLKTLGVQSVFHYLPLHISKMGRRFGGKEGDCPVTEDISNRLIRLPLFYSLLKEEQAWIIDSIKTWL